MTKRKDETYADYRKRKGDTLWKIKNKVKNRENERKRRTRHMNTLRGRFHYNLIAKKAAYKHTGIKFDLDVEWCLEQFEKGCAATGKKFKLDEKNGFQHPDSPSIDRLKSGGDYTKDNCKMITKRMNELKRNAVSEEMRALVKYMQEI